MDNILEILQLPFMQRALMGGLITGSVLSLLGVFVVLRKSAFFGDAVAHFTFAGIALGFLLAVNPIITAIVVSLVFGLGIVFIQNRVPSQSLDSLIGIFFSGAAALGIFIIGLLKGYRADLFQYLFGDIVAISKQDIIISIIIAVLSVVILYLAWKPLFKITFNRDIAKTDGINVSAYDYLFIGILAIVTAVSIKIVGIILVPALLVIPASSAKNISKSFNQMVILSLVFGIISVLVGLFASLAFDTASGATIVLTGIIIFLITTVFQKK